MAQYEQKTDSREFEVANADQHPGPQNLGPWGETPPGDAADIAIRLWGAAGLDRPAGLTWKADSVLVYMIADLVTASRGRIAEESPAAMAAHFDTCGQALVAAKRIQTSILEFLTCRPGERLGSAILIYQPRTTDPTGPSGDMVQYELGQAKPGQILLTENVSRRLHDLPGIELLAPPAPSGLAGDGSAGLTELIWTTPDRAALLRESAGDGVGPTRPEQRRDESSVGATLIVDSPFARRGPANETLPPVAATADYVVNGGVVNDGPETRSRRAGQVRTPGSEGFPNSQGSLLADSALKEGEFGERTLFTRTRVILGAVAVVLVAALIFVLFRPTSASKPRVTQPQSQTGGTESTDQQPTVDSPPQATTGPPEAQTVKPAAKEPAGPVKPPADNRAKNKKEAAVEPEAAEESGGLALSDIPFLLNGAVKDIGDGKYDKARLKYRTVLRLQPKNQEAIDGLKKLNKIQSDQQ